MIAPPPLPDPLAEVRAEFAAGLPARLDVMRTALASLDAGFAQPPADALYRAAHGLAGTAGSFGAHALEHVARDLETLARGWLAATFVPPDERRLAAAAVQELDAGIREYRAAGMPGAARSPAARLAVVGELTALINAAVDMREIFHGAILKVERVFDFRRASVVLVDDAGEHYYVHTMYDRARGGFVAGEAAFPIGQGRTGDAIRTGRPVRVDALPATEGILLQEAKLVSALIVPLRVGDRVVGALNFGHEDPGHYTEDDLSWAVVLGRQIETSLYYAKLLKTIAEQREALAREHTAVQQQRNQLDALIDASDAAIMLVGSDRRVAHANSEMARLLGIPGDALRGAGHDTVHRFLAGALKDPGALAAQEQALAGDAPLRDRVEFSFPHKVTCQRVVAPVREPDGTLVGHIVLYRDVTREVEADRLKSEFVSVVSHELRTPMTSVKTSLSLLLAGAAGPMDAGPRELLEIAVRNSDRLIRLVNDLLDLSRVDAGRMDLHPEPIALADAVRTSVEAVAAFAAAEGVTVELEPPPEPLFVQAVMDRVAQVLVNLLSNAIKFSPPRERVRVRWRQSGDAAIIEVADRGPGIPTEKVLAIFEPFRQLDSSTTREHGGAGLGLAISRGIIEALGGTLWVESKAGGGEKGERGSQFFVRLPLAQERPGPAVPVAAARPATVVLAHSDADWRGLAAARLALEGWHVTTAATGEEALALLAAQPAQLVIMARELSDTHGLEVVQQLRVDPRLFDTPILLVTEGDTPEALESGAEAWTGPDPEQVVAAAQLLLAQAPRPVVLVVDDDPMVRKTLERLLRRAGFACLIASDARQGLTFARQRLPAVIVTDYRMPRMDGLAFLRELRGDPLLRHVPAIMLTGHSTRALTGQAAELSAPTLRKPVEGKKLVEAIRQLLRAP